MITACVNINTITDLDSHVIKIRTAIKPTSVGSSNESSSDDELSSYLSGDNDDDGNECVSVDVRLLMNLSQ